MIYIKSPWELEIIRKSCQIVAGLLDALEELIKPGISTLELDKFAEEYILSRGGEPSFKGYRIEGLSPFPASICTSINEQIVHGIPSNKAILKEGDIIGIDAGVYYDGYHGDSARTYKVGNISAEAEKLLQVTKESLLKGISAAITGNRVGDISHAIGSFVTSKGFYVADDLTGHGIGADLHEDPMIPNIGKAGRGPRLYAGMTIAIEPMVNIGTNSVSENGWEFKTADNSLSAHFEHTILITEGEPEILTITG
ncbi:MAG: type I methionyl aminopeptidase [Candidatus Cloacimonas sp.]